MDTDEFIGNLDPCDWEKQPQRNHPCWKNRKTGHHISLSSAKNRIEASWLPRPFKCDSTQYQKFIEVMP